MVLKYLVLAVLTLALSVTADAVAEECGSLDNGYGPYDYSNPLHRNEYLPIVEKFHFTSEVESLIKGRSGTIIGDLDYTLRAFPNHHRALYAMMQYQTRNPVQLGSDYYSTVCYLRRAIRFARTDPVPHMLYGIHLRKKGDFDSALAKFLDAYSLAPQWVDLNYNLGLLYLDLGEGEKAQEHAKFAYDNGFALPGLRNKLARKGLWPPGEDNQPRK